VNQEDGGEASQAGGGENTVGQSKVCECGVLIGTPVVDLLQCSFTFRTSLRSASASIQIMLPSRSCGLPLRKRQYCMLGALIL
jgi:hypothetical protein